MNTEPHYPFSDLTGAELQLIMQRARHEQAAAVRGFLAALAGRLRRALTLPPRQREAQVWPPNNLPALSPTVHRSGHL